MKRILFDTSVYGELIEEFNVVDKIVKIIPKRFVVYGNNTPIIKWYPNNTPE